MGIAGVGSYNYSNYYQTNVNKHSEQASSSYGTGASKGLTLYVSDGEDEALTSVACANGTSASVFKADNYTEENPQYLVKFWDENGEMQEYTVNPKEVDPENASYIEMLAYSTYSDVQGNTTNAYRDFMSAAGGTSADIEYDSSNVNEKKNYKSMVLDFMQMQYDAGNMSDYLSYKQFYDYMDSTDIKDDYSKMLEKYGEQIKEKIKNGDTEPTYQIGGQTFTEAEWKKLIEKMDKDIEQIQAEQAERLEKQKAETVSSSSTVSETDSIVSEAQIQKLLEDTKIGVTSPEVTTDNYKINYDSEANCFDVYDKQGNHLGAFDYDDIYIQRDSNTGTEVLVSEHGTMSYDAIPLDNELKSAFANMLGVDNLETKELQGYSVKTHSGTGIQYLQKDDEVGKGGKLLIRSEADQKAFEELADIYATKYPNLIKDNNAALIYAELEIKGLAQHTPNGIITMGYDAVSYNDETDEKRNWSVLFTDKDNSYQTIIDALKEGNNSLSDLEAIKSWKDILAATNGYERVWSDAEEKQGYLYN